MIENLKDTLLKVRQSNRKFRVFFNHVPETIDGVEYVVQYLTISPLDNYESDKKEYVEKKQIGVRLFRMKKF